MADERAGKAGPEEESPPAERERQVRREAREGRGPVLRAASLVGILLARTFSEWREDHASQYGAAIAYYTFFSIAPLLILAIALAGVFFGADAAEGRIVTELQGFIGRDGAEAVQALVRRARGSDAGLTVSIAGIGALLLGATQVFNSLQTALNLMWEAPDRTVRTGVKWDLLQLARNRALSFAMVLVVGLLLVLSLLASAGVSLLGTFLSRLGREPAEVLFLRISEIVLSFGALTCLLAVVYKILPDARIAWRDVWFGAAVTSSLLTAGKLVIGWYLGSSSIGSVYGAAGSLIVLLVWVYYSSQLLLFGAEMTQVWACEIGSRRNRQRSPCPPPA
jgi:membrane protein